MSCFGPVSAGSSPVFVRPTTGAVSRRSRGLCYCCLSSACVLVPELREVVHSTGCLAVEAFWCFAAAIWRLRRCLVALACLRVGAIKAASLPLLVLDVAHDEASWPFWLPRPDPKKLSEFENNRNRCCLYLSTVSGRIRNILRRSSSK